MRRTLAARIGRTLAEDGGTSTQAMISVAIGVGIIVWPEAALSAMSLVLGIYLLADSAFCFAAVLLGTGRRWQRPGQGVASLAAAVLAFTLPDLTRSATLLVLAVWVVVMGAFRLRDAISFAGGVRVRWVPALLALLAIAAGCSGLIAPDRGVDSVMLNIEIFPILNGLTLLASSRRAAGPRSGSDR